MKYIYEEINNDFDGKSIKRTDEIGNVSWIPCNESNSDYAAYLESLEPKAKAPKVVDETTPE
jgi:hypothetical protein